MSTKFEFNLIYFLRYCLGESDPICNKIFDNSSDHELEFYSGMYRDEIELVFNVN